jgi:perosamine synthetase
MMMDATCNDRGPGTAGFAAVASDGAIAPQTAGERAAGIRFQVSKPVLAGRECEYVRDALESGWISSNGSYVGRFEQSVSSFVGVERGMAVSSGTAALHLACLALELGPRQDVIVPTLTYVASANAVCYCGGRPVFADCDPHTWNVTRALIEAAWTPRTVGVVLVHLYGLPAPVEEIAALCRERGAWLIEDCAECFGGTVGGRQVGTFGDAAAFSFFGNKIISTGEGGMVVVHDPRRREHVAMLRDQGMDATRRYWHPMTGYNYRMTNVTAAIGLGQSEMADYHLAERRRIALRYLEKLAPLQESGMLRLPVEPVDTHNVYWLFSVVLTDGGEGRRERIRQTLLAAHGIETRPFFVPMHKLPMFRTKRHFPHSEFLGEHGINLPTYSGLSANDIDEICAALSDIIVRESGATVAVEKAGESRPSVVEQAVRPIAASHGRTDSVAGAVSPETRNG